MNLLRFMLFRSHVQIVSSGPFIFNTLALQQYVFLVIGDLILNIFFYLKSFTRPFTYIPFKH
jgi:hypothetical protein